ncbi:MAG: M23 family peptidase, partial [Gillisia sp.]
MKRLSFIPFLLLAITACNKDVPEKDVSEVKVVEKKPVREEYGFVLDDYEVVRDTIRSGDTFGLIMDKQGVSSSKVYEVTQEVNKEFDPTRLVVGKPYV